MRAQLEAFLGHWRAFLRPQHSLVFSQLNGAPLTAQGLGKLFYTSAHRIAGKKTNPHLVRDMVVTHLRRAAPLSPLTRNRNPPALLCPLDASSRPLFRPLPAAPTGSRRTLGHAAFRLHAEGRWGEHGQ